MFIKQNVIELCDDMICFWQQLKDETESISDNNDSVKLVCDKWYNHFERHGDTIGKFSEVKHDIEEINNLLP